MTGAAVGAALFSPLSAAAASGSATSPGQPTQNRSATAAGDDTSCGAAVAGHGWQGHTRTVSSSLADPGESVCLPAADHPGSRSVIQPQARKPRHQHQHARPMTSGERQYRAGCQQGYIIEGCDQFNVRNLLRHGIDPFL